MDISVFFQMKNLEKIYFEGNCFLKGKYDILDDDYIMENKDWGPMIVDNEWSAYEGVENNVLIKDKIIKSNNKLEVLELHDITIEELNIFKDLGYLRVLGLIGSKVKSFNIDKNAKIFSSLLDLSLNLSGNKI